MPRDARPIAAEVSYIEYRHAADGERYYHHFRPGRRPRLDLVADGRVLMSGRPGMVRDFPQEWEEEDMLMFENPRRRRGSRGRARDSKARFVSGRRRHGRRRRRRNPGALATYGLPQAVLGNPRRRRRRGRRRSSGLVRRRRRHYRRNPRLIGGYVRQLQRRLPDVGWGLEGMLLTTAAPQYLSRFLPIASKGGNQIVYYGIKTAVALANGRTVQQFAGGRAGEAASIGGLLAVGHELVRDWIYPMLGLSAYLDGMGEYLDAGAIGQLPSAGMTIPPDEEDDFSAYGGPPASRYVVAG